uniref:Integrase catalytic domain-containing protein n=1 Tax=Bionectria ochroleuca TaxID=29856 RepID=A0A8H7K3I9_BIOOC
MSTPAAEDDAGQVPKSTMEMKAMIDEAVNAHRLPAIPNYLVQSLDHIFFFDPSHELGRAPNEAKEETKNTWLLKAMCAWDHRSGTLLFEWFLEDFEDWSAENFESCNRVIIRALKERLQKGGIPLPGKSNTKTSKRLAEILTWEDLPPHTNTTVKSSIHDDDELLEADNDRTPENEPAGDGEIPDFSPEQPHDQRSTQGSPAGVYKPPARANPTNEIPQPHQQGPHDQRSTQESPAWVNQPPEGALRRQGVRQSEGRDDIATRVTTRGGGTSDPSQSQRHQRGDHRSRHTAQLPRPDEPVPPGWYHALPPAVMTNEVIESAEIKAFTSMWNKDNNFTGELYDILDHKMRIFTDTCELLRIQYAKLHALFPNILSKRAQEYFLDHMNRGMRFDEMYAQIKREFDSDINRAQYHADWSSMTFRSVQGESENADKSQMEVLKILLDRLQKCQRALGPAYKDETHLVANTLRAVQGVPELKIALANPQRAFNSLSSQLLSTMKVEENTPTPGHFYTDRRYQSRDRREHTPDRGREHHGYNRPRGRLQGRYSRPRTGGERSQSKATGRCWICGRTDCRSTNHSLEEQEASKKRWLEQRRARGEPRKGFTQFLAEVEPLGDSESEQETDYQLSESGESEPGDPESSAMAYFLANEAFKHRLQPKSSNTEGKPVGVPSAPIDQIFSQYLIDSAARWFGIIPDTGAASISTAGANQTQALLRIRPDIQISESESKGRVRFGAGEPLEATGVVPVPTPIGDITFHVIPADTPFLMCIKDMDELGVYLDNTRNELVKRGTRAVKRIPVTRRWGHPWLQLDNKSSALPRTYHTEGQSEEAAELTEAQLRRIHRRFGHPSVEKLWNILQRADKKANRSALELINRVCHHCQIKGKAPQRFKFVLKDDVDFNYEIVVDIMYLDGKPVLHVIDASTSFQAATFLDDLTAANTWLALKKCWLDTYLGPPDVISFDAGTNFAAAEFKGEARLMGITCHQIPIEAHWSIGKIEKHHAP